MLVEDLKTAMQRLGPCLVQLFGQGESPMTITYLPHSDHVLEGTPAQLKRLASAGIARTDVEVKIFDPKDLERPPGEMGEIVTRSDLVMKGYWRNPEATRETIRDGWLHTGDMGYIDESGYLFIMDRSKDMIITGGENVYPREIEEAIYLRPEIEDCAVIGVPDKQWGERVVAYLVLRKGQRIEVSDLKESLTVRLSAFKLPKEFFIVKELPKSSQGKILRKEVRKLYLP